MIRLQAKRVISMLLLCAMLLSLCGCQQRSSGTEANQAEPVPAQHLDGSDLSEVYKNDPVITGHTRNNQNLSTKREKRSANAFRLFIENTETMAGFVNFDRTTIYQSSLNCLMDVMSSYSDMDAYMLNHEVVWEPVKLDGHFRSSYLAKDFYTGRKLPQESPLKELSYLGEEAFPENTLTVLVSNFIEPRYDLNGLSNQIDSYFSKYPYSAACVVALTSEFKGDFHIVTNAGKVTSTLTNFEGEAPFYMVMVGPEQDVRDAVENLSNRLAQFDIDCSYCTYTNSMHQQILLEPLHFDVITDSQRRKAPTDTICSYNTYGVDEPNSGGYFAKYEGRVKTLDAPPQRPEEYKDEIYSDEISTSTQISLISTDYDGTTQYGWDYELYMLDPQRGDWIPAGKNEKFYTEVSMTPVNGPLEDDFAAKTILENGRQQLVQVKLRFRNGSALSRDQIYRVELRLHLNQDGNEILRVDSTDLNAYSISRQDYDAVMGVYRGFFDWNQYLNHRSKVQNVIRRTPNLSAFLTSMEQMADKYRDETEMVEYLDFVFNVPSAEK